MVQPGDTLWAISRANGLTVAQLAAANNMNPNDLLLIGRHLIIPSSGSGSPVRLPSPVRRRAAPGRRAAGHRRREQPVDLLLDVRRRAVPGGSCRACSRSRRSRLALQPLFIHWATYYDLSLPLLEAIAWQESGWQQGVVSSAGAVGTGQIMPEHRQLHQQHRWSGCR